MSDDVYSQIGDGPAPGVTPSAWALPVPTGPSLFAVQAPKVPPSALAAVLRESIMEDRKALYRKLGVQHLLDATYH